MIPATAVNVGAITALPEDWDRALYVGAHPTDAEYGVASAVARWTAQRKQVTYLLVTRGEAGINGMHPDQTARLREDEQRLAAAEVGVETVQFLDYQDGVVEYGLPLRRDIARAIRRHRPDVVIGAAFTVWTLGGVPHQADHRMVGLATVDAARDAGNRWIFPELLDEGLEPWPGVRFVCFAGAQQPTHGVDVTGHLDRAIASLQAHAGYLKGLVGRRFDPVEFVTWNAVASGERMGVGAAVLLDVVPLIPDHLPPCAAVRGRSPQP